MSEETYKKKVKAVLLKKKVVKPEHADEVTNKIWEWFLKNRRELTLFEMEEILKPYQ